MILGHQLQVLINGVTQIPHCVSYTEIEGAVCITMKYREPLELAKAFGPCIFIPQPRHSAQTLVARDEIQCPLLPSRCRLIDHISNGIAKDCDQPAVVHKCRLEELAQRFEFVFRIGELYNEPPWRWQHCGLFAGCMMHPCRIRGIAVFHHHMVARIAWCA